MKKLTCMEAYEVHILAMYNMKRKESLRIGQAVMNALPQDVYDYVRGSDIDFCESNDLKEVLGILYSENLCNGE